jgi:hypothetical protein
MLLLAVVVMIFFHGNHFAPLRANRIGRHAARQAIK